MRAMAMVPTYNEALNIENLLREILKQGTDIGAVVVDDNSPDGTASIVKKLRQEDPRVHLVLRMEERGRGTAGIVGFQYAVSRGVDFVIEMDADFSHPPSYFPYFLSQMEDCDLLIGSRLLEGGGERGRSYLRRSISRLANAYIRRILNLPVRDCTSGYRVFRREVLEAIDLDQMMSQGPSVVEEVLYKAYKRGFSAPPCRGSPCDKVCRSSNVSRLRCRAGSRGKSTGQRPCIKTGPSKRSSSAGNRRDSGAHISGTRTKADGPGSGRKQFGRNSPLIVGDGCLSPKCRAGAGSAQNEIQIGKSQNTT